MMDQDTFSFNSIEEAIQDIKEGKVVIVVDDEDRENEGDFLTAARNMTPELVNFMAKEGRGLICVPLTEDRCKELDLDMMVVSNTATHETAFTVSVDLLGYGCTTGISAQDRSKTIMALINPEIKNDELGKPGHIFPSQYNFVLYSDLTNIHNDKTVNKVRYEDIPKYFNYKVSNIKFVALILFTTAV
jgi:3,4-dihydroxy-2-butanone 4-phosphate synthase